MKKYKKLKIKSLNNKNVIIGYFDIIHKGHFEIFKRNNNSCILTFKSTPSKKEPINNFKKRISQLNEMGFKEIYVFDLKKNNMSSSDFYNLYLKKAKKIIVGSQFKFGNDQKLLIKMNKKNVVFINEKSSYSTTLVKNYLSNGYIEKVNKMLVEQYYVEEKVKHGKRIGRKIGFPTINFYFDKQLHLKFGVYLSKTMVDNKIYKSISIYGIPKSIKNDKKIVMETHIIDFNEKIYGKKVKVFIYKYLNELIKFETQNELIDKIKEYKNICISTKY